MKQITGGVCAAQGFSAAGIHCGIRRNQSKRDLALIYSAVPASAAAVYTSNLVKGAPLTVTKAHLSDGKAQAVICNSGNADGAAVAEEMSALTASVLHIAPQDVIVASTGVIGQPLDLAPIRAGLPQLAAAQHGDAGVDDVLAPGQGREHAHGVVMILRLAEDGAVEIHDRIRRDDNVLRRAGLRDLLRLVQGQFAHSGPAPGVARSGPVAGRIVRSGTPSISSSSRRRGEPEARIQFMVVPPGRVIPRPDNTARGSARSGGNPSGPDSSA